jgi:hypothetical protein
MQRVLVRQLHAELQTSILTRVHIDDEPGRIVRVSAAGQYLVVEMLVVDADPDQLHPLPGRTGFPVSGDDHGALKPETPLFGFIPIGLITEPHADQPGMSGRAGELMT